MPSPAAPPDAAGVSPQSLLAAVSIIEEFGHFGLIWLDRELVVTKTFGRAAEFVALGRPLTDSVLAVYGLESEIAGLESGALRRLELPAVAAAAADGDASKRNFSFFWNSQTSAPMAFVHRTDAQSAMELELSKQIRARLMAEAETDARSRDLARANSDLESFAAIVSHDLKAPLRHMRLAAEAAMESLKDDSVSRVHGALTAIAAEARQMSRMLTDLFDYSSLGRKYEALEVVDMANLIDALAQPWRALGHAVEISGLWPTLTTLKAPLDLVLRNLLGNAVQHNDRAVTQLQIDCRMSELQMTLTIRDDGPGIDTRHHETIFLPFRSLTTVVHGTSTGIGLAMVRKAVEAVGGRVSVSSDPSQGRGTCFTVVWPMTIDSF